jgi:MscS family membrane protein
MGGADLLAQLAMPAWIEDLTSMPLVRGTAAATGAIVAAYFAELLMQRVLLRLTQRTKTTLDDQIVELLRRPVFLSVIFAGLAWAALLMQVGEAGRHFAFAVLQSLAAVVWAVATFRIGALLLHTLADRVSGTIVRPPSLPVFLIILRVAVIAGSLYFVFLAWNIDLTAWLASVGIAGGLPPRTRWPTSSPASSSSRMHRTRWVTTSSSTAVTAARSRGWAYVRRVC